MLLTVECQGCGEVTPQVPLHCAKCGCSSFHVLTSASLLELEEDPDRRPYSWELDADENGRTR